MTEVFRPQPDAGVQLSGRVPDALKKMLAEQGGQPQPPQPAQQPQQPQQPQQQPMEQMGPMGPVLAPQGALGKILEELKGFHYEVINLPSKGRFYTDPNLAGGALHVRPMTGAEEEILATPRYVKKNEAMDMIFKRCIQEPINPLDLLTIDRNYLLIWLRGISYSHEYEVDIKCPKCGSNFPWTVDLNSLPLNTCPDDFALTDLNGVLPKTGYKFSYRLSTGRDETAIAQYRERKTRDWGAQQADDTLTYRTAMLLNNIEEVTNTKELQVLLKRLPVSDGNYLRSLINDPPFGVDTNIGVVCSICGEESNLELPLEASFFFPQYKKKEKKD